MASRGVNKVTLIGTIGNDLSVRYMPNGNPVLNVSLATSESWLDKATGKRQERTEWHRVVVFGKLAEIAAEYGKKGGQIYMMGKLQTREWEKDGVKRYTTEIIVDQQGEMQLLGARPAGGGSSDTPQQAAPRQQQAAAPARNPASQPSRAPQQPIQPPDFDDMPEYDRFDSFDC